MTVKLNVIQEDSEKIMDENFWSEGVQCREWYHDNSFVNEDNNG